MKRRDDKLHAERFGIVNVANVHQSELDVRSTSIYNDAIADSFTQNFLHNSIDVRRREKYAN